jgi:hypothetical protein
MANSLMWPFGVVVDQELAGGPSQCRPAVSTVDIPETRVAAPETRVAAPDVRGALTASHRSLPLSPTVRRRQNQGFGD